jgi:hypothetical protein
MSHPAPTTAPGSASSTGDSPARFLSELENLFSLLRVYGTEHPAFKRGVGTAATSLARQLRVSVSPRGFTLGKTLLADPTLLAFCQRLRSMGLVGLVMDPGITPAQVTALVLTLDECDRSHLSGTVAVEKIAAASGRHVTAIPLRLGSLRLTEGTDDDPAAGDQQSNLWRDLFAEACSGGEGGSEAGELAESFELALKAVASPAQWDAMVAMWVRQLAAAEPGGRRGETRGGGAGGGGGTGGGRRAGNSDRLDAAAAFLGALSPHLCRRLLAETFGKQSAPQNVIMALADRLPKGVVLGALAAVDRGNGQPSAAALALLRKIASNLPGAGDAAQSAPRTTAEMVEIASSLERLLGSKEEASFVPESYLAQRQELSGNAVPAGDRGVNYPGDRDTARHAAGLAFQILSTPDTAAADLASSLTYVRNRTGDWIKAGEFALAAEGIALAQALSNHWDRSVAKPALDVVAHGVTVEDLVEGSRNSSDRATAAEGIAGLLRQLDGEALARVLLMLKPTTAGGHEAVLDGFRKMLPSLGEEAVRGLCKAIKDNTPPPALLSVISNLGAADGVKAVAAILPHAASATRRAIVHAIFRHDFRWPLSLTEQLLKDDEAEIRRLAVMKLVSDADLATAARVFQAATNRKGPYEPDVALGLAELLGRHRRHPDVRAAYRQWLWSGRRWAALFSLSLVDRRSAA